MITDAEKQIVHTLSEIQRSKGEIRLLNVYKGVPISTLAKILDIYHLSLYLQVDKFQLICLYQEKETYLSSPLLPNILSARVEALSVLDLEVVLGQFKPAPNSIGYRSAVRIQPKESLHSEICAGSKPERMQAELADISQDGLAIYIHKELLACGPWPKGTRVSLTLELPALAGMDKGQGNPADGHGDAPMDRFNRQELRLPHLSTSRQPAALYTAQAGYRDRTRPVEVHGEVANFTAQPDGVYRIGMHILAGDASRPVIAQFIAQRQSEIIRELRGISKLLKPE